MNQIEDFKSFLEGVTAEEFNRSSAIAFEGGYHGPEGFTRFIEERHKSALGRYNEFGGSPPPTIYLANSEESREYEAYHDETNQQMCTRLRQEARAMRADMVFVALLSYAALSEVDNLDGLDGNSVRAAVKRGDLKVFYGWYAEHRHGRTVTHPGEAQRVGCLWPIDDDGRLGEPSIGTPEIAPLFHAILP